MTQELPFIVGELRINFILGRTSLPFYIVPANAIVRLHDANTKGAKAIQASPDSYVNGLPVNRLTDEWSDLSVQITASKTVFVNNKALTRIFDKESDGGEAIEGSPNSFSG